MGQVNYPKVADNSSFDEDSSDALSPEQPASHESQGSVPSPMEARISESLPTPTVVSPAQVRMCSVGFCCSPQPQVFSSNTSALNPGEKMPSKSSMTLMYLPNKQKSSEAGVLKWYGWFNLWRMADGKECLVITQLGKGTGFLALVFDTGNCVCSEKCISGCKSESEKQNVKNKNSVSLSAP